MNSTQRATFVTDSPEATLALGEVLGRGLGGGSTIGLVGPLGAGKTQLVKGIAAGNANDDSSRVTSPTFTLINEYHGRLTVFHIDAYRLKGADALLALGFDELLRPDAIAVVEWADRVRSAMPEESLWIEITPTGETERTLCVTATTSHAASCVDLLRQAYD